MANEKDQHTSSPQNTDTGAEPRGRIHNTQNPALEKQDTSADISNVDQQEGSMNNGESGNSLKQNETK